jgi:hypothetical protein
LKLAIIENGTIVNIINGEVKTASKFYKLVVLVTEDTGEAYIGNRFNGTKFEQPKPFPSWLWNEDSFEYVPPKAKPDGDYYWDEAELDWLVIPEPELEPEAEPEPHEELLG